MTTVDPRRPTGADEARSIARNMAHGIRDMAQATAYATAYATAGARSRHRRGAVSRRLRVARRGGPRCVPPLLAPGNRPLASAADGAPGEKASWSSVWRGRMRHRP